MIWRDFAGIFRGLLPRPRRMPPANLNATTPTNMLNVTEALCLCIEAQAGDVELESAFDDRADSLVEALVKVITHNAGQHHAD